MTPGKTTSTTTAALTLPVTGMACSGCDSVIRAVARRAGVNAAFASQERAEIAVSFSRD